MTGMAKGHIYIGTSGWHYKHWKHIFYPNEVKNADQLSFYMRSFNTVELNNSFYRVPTVQAFDKWKNTAPNNFRFAVKANQYITHRKKLHEVSAATDDFIHRASRLGNKLGPILFQLPPNWKINIDRLSSFLAALPPRHRYTFEFRNPSWYTESLYQLLGRYHCAFCIYELAGHHSPIETTADFVYIRLHGPGGKYQGSYTDASLSAWADRCHTWQRKGKDVFFYFDNDENAYAVFNARTLEEMIR